jgi:hypothetical protein
MPQPYDYTSQFGGNQSPAASFLGGLEAGTKVAGLQQQQQARDLALQRQQQMQSELATLSRNPSPQAIAAMSVKYPELSEQFKRSYDMMAPEAQRNDLSHMAQVYSAVQTGRSDLAVQMLANRAQALENSGAPAAQIQAARTMAQWVQQHPESFRASSGLMLASALGPEKFASTFETLNKVSNDTAMQPLKLARERAETTNINSQIADRAARLRLDADKLSSETQTKLLELNQKFGELKDDARKLVNDNVVASTASEQSAGDMLDLARRFDEAGGGNGSMGTMDEAWKKLSGRQDGFTSLRQEYLRLRNGAVLKMLPPGPATDKDITQALSSFPPETADSKYLGSFLRGMAKLQQQDAAVSAARAEWVGAVGHLGKPKQDIEVEGIRVPAGTAFPEFARQFVQRMADNRAAAQQAPAQTQQRSYMRHAGGQ